MNQPLTNWQDFNLYVSLCARAAHMIFNIKNFVKDNPDMGKQLIESSPKDLAEQAKDRELHGSGGRCFIDTCNLILLLNKEKDADRSIMDMLQLCHGVAESPVHGLITHGWIELSVDVEDDDGEKDTIHTVLDVGSDVPLSREVYYEVGKIDPDKVVRYSYPEALEAMLINGNQGPWCKDFLASCHQDGVK